MLLKRLEVFGFKSFADKTAFDFGPGPDNLMGTTDDYYGDDIVYGRGG